MERPGPFAFWFRHNSWSTPIGIIADPRVQRDIAEQLDAVRLTSASDAVGAEDVRCVAACGTGEDGHVLDHA